MNDLLPKNGSAWPPPEAASHYSRMRSPDAWYSGDPGRLIGAGVARTITTPGQGRSITTMNPGGGVASSWSSSGDSFWSATTTPGEEDTRRHLPVAQDIATMSADLLFSEPPSFKVKGSVYPKGHPQEGEPDTASRAAQQRLDAVLEACNIYSLLLAAAETSSALGSVGLRVAVDRSVIPDRPVITRQDADSVVPYYRWGQLIAVAFWTNLQADRDSNTYWRLIELHQAGRVWPALYKGSADNVGIQMPLTEQPGTANLAALVGADGSILLDQGGGRTATSIPNMLPDPMDRRNQAGRSDFTVPVMGLFSDIDKTHTQFMDELDDAKSRLFIADSLLQGGAPGEGLSFDTDRRLYRRVHMPPTENDTGALPIDKVQFDLRVEEYLSAVDALVHRAVEAAGYNARNEREADGQAMTATEVTTRNRKSMSTRDKKIRYWKSELEAILTTLLRVDVAQFAPYEQVDGASVRVQPFPVEVLFPEAVQPTQMELAQTAKALREAGESVVEIQRVLHPDWTERRLNEAASKIENAASVVDPVSFGTAGQGVGPGDGL